MKIRKSTVQRIEHCPWKGDISIDRSSFIGDGSFESVAGQEYHNVYCSADGPNPDGETMHHGQIGYWSKFSSAKDANEFAVRLWKKIVLITGVVPPVYASGEDKNEHAKWCMHEADVKPEGTHPLELPTKLSGYE